MEDRITPELLLHAYTIGVFPMAETRNDPEIFWVDPRHRGVLPLDRFHLSKSLRRAMRKSTWRVAINTDFEGVVEGCADRSETWINDEIKSLYLTLFQRGNAHSVEIWEGEALVGGVYGVTKGGAFFGESMFSRRTNASKMALAACVDRLVRAGFTLFDTQFVTDHLVSLGAEEISRDRYHALLRAALGVSASFTNPPAKSLYELAQRSTQMS